MGYTTVRTVNTGDPWTARDVNVYIRDNFAAGIPDLMTTKGDIVAATGADAAARVGAGANGTVLFADSGAAAGVIFGDTDNKVRVIGNNGETDGNTTSWVRLTMLTNEEFDVGGNYSSPTFTASQPGFYIVSINAHGGWIASAVDEATPAEDSIAQIAFYVNGSLYCGAHQVIAQEDTNTVWADVHFSGTHIIWLSSGDTLEFYGRVYNGWNSGQSYDWEGLADYVHISILPLF